MSTGSETDAATATTMTTNTVSGETLPTQSGPTADTSVDGSGSASEGACTPSQLECGNGCVECPQSGVTGVECRGGVCVASACQDTFFRCDDGSCCPWHVENVEQSGQYGPDVDIALDSFDLPHIAYIHAVTVMSPSVRHAQYDGFDWTMENVDDAGTSMPYVDVAIGSDGTLHLLYTPLSGSDNIAHAFRSDGSWSTGFVYPGTVDNDYRGGQAAADSTGAIHIAYRNESYMGEVFHAYWDGGWTTFAHVVGSLDTGLPQDSFSIAAAPNDQPHIVFYDQQGAELGHAVKTGPILDPVTWSETTVDLGTIYSPSVSLSPDGDLEVAYFNATEGELRVATRVASAWDRQGIWNEGTSERISLDHGPDARPHVAWVSDEGRLMYAVRSDEGWDVSLVDDGTGVTWVSLAVDGGGVPHMAFRDQEYGGIRYAAGRSM